MTITNTLISEKIDLLKLEKSEANETISNLKRRISEIDEELILLEAKRSVETVEDWPQWKKDVIGRACKSISSQFKYEG